MKKKKKKKRGNTKKNDRIEKKWRIKKPKMHLKGENKVCDVFPKLQKFRNFQKFIFRNVLSIRGFDAQNLSWKKKHKMKHNEHSKKKTQSHQCKCKSNMQLQKFVHSQKQKFSVVHVFVFFFTVFCCVDFWCPLNPPPPCFFLKNLRRNKLQNLKRETDLSYVLAVTT